MWCYVRFTPERCYEAERRRVGCVTECPLGGCAVRKISPIPRFARVHVCSIVASRIAAAGYKLMRSFARNTELIARPAQTKDRQDGETIMQHR